MFEKSSTLFPSQFAESTVSVRTVKTCNCRALLSQILSDLESSTANFFNMARNDGHH